MNKQELSNLVAEILAGMGSEPQVKAGDYRPTCPGPERKAVSYTHLTLPTKA